MKQTTPEDSFVDPQAALNAAQVVADKTFAALDAALADEIRCMNAAGISLVRDGDATRGKELFELAVSTENLRTQISRLQPRRVLDAPPGRNRRSETAPEAHPPARLSLARAPLLSAAIPVRRMRSARRSGKVRVTFADGQVAFDFGEAAFTVPAAGHWPGFAVVTAKFVFSWLARPDNTDPVQIQIKDRDFHINKVHTPCHWEPSQPPRE